jgi:hypothetical protein
MIYYYFMTIIVLLLQVRALRIWDVETAAYRPIDPTVDGAPRDEESAKQYWAELLAELTAKHGAEYMATLLGDAAAK